jgi:peptidyl-prolyl cis-trans isomerase D
LVLTDYGYHIIKLIAVKPAKIQTLSEVKDMIVQRLKLQRANDLFAELAEKFNNTVYEQSDSLKPAAELAKTSVQQGVWLSKGQPPAGLWTDKVLQAVFSDDAIKNKRNTAAVEVGPNKLLAARVTEYKPASVRPLAEVSANIRQRLQLSQASELAKQQGKNLLDKLQHGEKAGVIWKAAQTITRNQRSNIDPGLLHAIFGADTGKLPVYVGVDSSNGFELARIDEVKDAAIVDESKIARYEQQIRQITGDALWRAYIEDARKRASITMKAFEADEKK